MIKYIKKLANRWLNNKYVAPDDFEVEPIIEEKKEPQTIAGILTPKSPEEQIVQRQIVKIKQRLTDVEARIKEISAKIKE